MQTHTPQDIFAEAMSAHAQVRISHQRPYDYDEKTHLYLYRRVDDDEMAGNIVTNAGRVGLHTFCYNTASRTNGFNYIALTNDSAAADPTDTVLATEIADGDGLARAQGTVTLATGSGTQTTIAKTFTYVGVSQAVQKSALFTAGAVGIMAHEVKWTQRTLFTNDTLTVTYTITLT